MHLNVQKNEIFKNFLITFIANTQIKNETLPVSQASSMFPLSPFILMWKRSVYCPLSGMIQLHKCYTNKR